MFLKGDDSMVIAKYQLIGTLYSQLIILMVRIRLASSPIRLTRLIIRGVREKYDGGLVPSIIRREFRGK